jgi:serine/threonine protein phosphatase PrpC
MARGRGTDQVGSRPPEYREWARAASVEDIGRRAELEDSHFWVDPFAGEKRLALGGIFDGHYDDSVSKLAGENGPRLVDERLRKGEIPEVALGRALSEADTMAKGLKGGSTALAFLLMDGQVALANLGDSVLLLVDPKGEKVLTEEHRLSNPKERARIKALGTEIDGNYVMLPDGNGVMCTRALGDRRFRPVGVICEPFTARTKVPNDALWLIAACDGLTDELSPSEIAKVSRECGTPREVCETLRDKALIERGGTDNLTILVVGLRERAETH